MKNPTIWSVLRRSAFSRMHAMIALSAGYSTVPAEAQLRLMSDNAPGLVVMSDSDIHYAP